MFMENIFICIEFLSFCFIEMFLFLHYFYLDYNLEDCYLAELQVLEWWQTVFTSDPVNLLFIYLF